MKTLSQARSILLAIFGACLMLACSAPQLQEAALFDFGALYATLAGVPALPPVSIAEVNAPTWLDGTMMAYRLSYANDQQPRYYAHNRWAMTPARLFEQRLKARIAQAGGTVLSARDSATNVPVIRIELDDFSQAYDSATHSVGQVTVRVSLFRGRSLLKQKTFMQHQPAPTADAAGGARALAEASDAAIADMMVWLAKPLLP